MEVKCCSEVGRNFVSEHWLFGEIQDINFEKNYQKFVNYCQILSELRMFITFALKHSKRPQNIPKMLKTFQKHSKKTKNIPKSNKKFKSFQKFIKHSESPQNIPKINSPQQAHITSVISNHINQYSHNKFSPSCR